MADTKISALAALGAAPASGDLFEVVDISDTSMAGTGTNKKIVASDLLAGVYIAGGTDVAVADGGTGSSTASGARTALGVAIGSQVQAWDADLDTLASMGVTEWTTWAGTWTNLTVGTGGSASESYQYRQLGKTVTARFDVTLGSSGPSVGTGPILSLPANADTSQTNGVPLGFCRMQVGGTAFLGIIDYNATGSIIPRTIDASATTAKVAAVNATLPGTWAAGDKIFGQFIYRVA